MDFYGQYMKRLIGELSKLPGIGEKTATRLAFHIISRSEQEVEDLAKAIVFARRNVKLCHNCYTLTDKDTCDICANVKRNSAVIMVVESSKDLAAYEKTHQFHGLYHVLGGVISPLLNVTPNDIKIKELIERSKEGVEEVILATNSTVEGEATAVYISKLIKPLGIKTTRIASGVPIGGDIEYIDEITLSRALQGRVEY